MTGHLLGAAVRNNAAWCDLVCAAVGGSGTFTPDLYVNLGDVPRFYPNVVTLSETVGESDVVRAMAGREHWSVKDSFGSLDLTVAGLARLFGAQWLLAPRHSEASATWRAVDGAAALQEWLASRAAEGDDTHGRAWSARADLAFVSVLEDAVVVGSGILMEAHGVVGLSNVACSAGDPAQVWSGLVAAAASLFPGVDVVGYESGEDLSVALSVGCEALGPLAVWAR